MSDYFTIDNTMGKVYEKFFQDNKNSFQDLNLVTEDQEVFKTHKLVLSAWSPDFFGNILEKLEDGDNLRTQHSIYLHGVYGRNLKSLLKYIYESRIDVPQDEVEEFISTGHKLKIIGLPKLDSIPKPPQPISSGSRVKMENFESVEATPLDLTKAEAEESTIFTDFDQIVSKYQEQDMTERTELNAEDNPKTLESNQVIIPEVVRLQKILNDEDDEDELFNRLLESDDDDTTLYQEPSPKKRKLDDHLEKETIRIETREKNPTSAPRGKYSERQRFSFSEQWEAEQFVEDKTIMIGKNHFVCGVEGCKYSSNMKGNMKAHLESHVEGSFYSCKTCPEKFRSRFGVQNHIKNKHLKLNEVTMNKDTTEIRRKESSENSKIKVKVSSNEEGMKVIKDNLIFKFDVYSCRFCDYAPVQKKNRGIVERHIETHIEGLQFSCKDCGEKFENRSKMYSHKYKLHRI